MLHTAYDEFVKKLGDFFSVSEYVTEIDRILMMQCILVLTIFILHVKNKFQSRHRGFSVILTWF